MKRFLAASAVALTLLPAGALALEGTGPRLTITGTVKEIRMTEKQKFDQVGGEVIVSANNGQEVTLVITKDTEIISEGRLSRRQLIPENITKGMAVRVRGWRLGSNSLTASLFIILNVSVNPVLSANGTITAIDGSNVSLLSQDGKIRTFKLTNESQVNISYTIYGTSGLNLLGKKALLTLNPNDNTQIRIIRVTGDKDPGAAGANVSKQ